MRVIGDVSENHDLKSKKKKIKTITNIILFPPHPEGKKPCKFTTFVGRFLSLA